jgi:hypothetical protein
MRSRRALVVSTLAVTALAGTTFAGTAVASDGDDDDKNVLLAEAQFQLFLVRADFVPTDITCTHPPVRDVAGELLCYALISDRVTVAAVATMDLPGEYAFQPINKVDPADLDDPAGREDATSPVPPQGPDLPGTPTEPESVDPQSATDQAILASIDVAVADAQELGQVLTENNASITSVDNIGYHAPTSTVQVAVTTSGVDPANRDAVAFFVTDVMAYLWMENEPTREVDATIRPRLEVTVDGVLYGTPYEVMVDVADYAITEGEWLEIVTGNAAVAPTRKSGLKSIHKVDGKGAGSTQPSGIGPI